MSRNSDFWNDKLIVNIHAKKWKYFLETYQGAQFTNIFFDTLKDASKFYDAHIRYEYSVRDINEDPYYMERVALKYPDNKCDVNKIETPSNKMYEMPDEDKYHLVFLGEYDGVLTFVLRNGYNIYGDKISEDENEFEEKDEEF